MMAWFFSTEYKDYEHEVRYAPKVKTIPSERERLDALGKSLAQALFERSGAERLPMNSPEFPWWGSGEFPNTMKGWRWPMPDAPFRTSLARVEGPLVDIVSSCFGAWGISERVIDMIEAIEPGVHQYLPLELLQPDGTVHPDRRWLLNVCTRAEVIDVERSNVMWLEPPMEYLFADASVDRRLVVKAEEASRRAIWFEWRYFQGGFGNLVSDALWNALQDAGVHGWAPHVDYPRHIEEL